MLEFLTILDRSLFLILNKAVANPVFDLFFPLITEEQNLLVPVLILAGFALYKTPDKLEMLNIFGLCILTAVIANQLCHYGLKPFFHRYRPCHPAYFIDNRHLFLEGANFLTSYRTSFSFPSNHAVTAFALVTPLACAWPEKGFCFLVAASLMAWSRIYVGVHYPLDVLAGAAYGMGVGRLAWEFRCLLRKRRGWVYEK